MFDSSANVPWFLSHDDPETLYRTGTYLCFDTETDTEMKGSALCETNDIVLACWIIVVDGVIVKKAHKFGGIYEQQELLDDIAKVDFVIAHNLKFDIQWMKRCGLELRDVLGYDTLLAEWVLDGNKKKPRDLASLAKKYGVKGKVDIVSKLIKLGVHTRDIHPKWLLTYCYADVMACYNVFLKQCVAVSEEQQWHLVHVRNLTCSALADIEFEGLCLDEERVMAEYRRAMETKERFGAELAILTGGINLNSPKQFVQYLYGTLGMAQARDYRGNIIKTNSGESTANAKVLALLKPTTDAQKNFLTLYKEYNKQASLLEKNLDYFKLTCEQKGGMFYGQFMQNVVQTHRLASAGIPILFEGLKKAKSVQLQNIPREYKSLFYSGHRDWVIMEADGSGLEFRVAVDLGHDKVGLAEIENGTDIHTFTANVLLEGNDPELLQLSTAKERRQAAKKSTFRPLYGGSQGSPALVAYCEYFKNKYLGISETQRSWALKCVDKKQFTTPYGMTFFFPDTKMNRSGYINNTTSIYNYPVQGFATGEIIPIALVYFWHRTRELRVKMFSTIHDSLASKVHVEDVEQVKDIAKQALTHDVYEFLARVYKYQFKVPLGLGLKVSIHWADTDEEVKIDCWPNGKEVIR